MNSFFKNVLAVIAGIIIGSVVNMGIIMLSSSIISPPDGVNPADIESIKANMHLYEAKHFVMPFLAHALGTLVGAFIAVLIATTNKFSFAMAIGVVFLLGGIANVFMLPSPMWFNVLDLVVAYIPMAYFGYKLGSR
jgi:hypothetical protein